MNITTLLADKKNNSEKIKTVMNISLKYKPLGLIKLTNNSLKNELIEGLKTLHAGFIVCSKDITENQKISNNIVLTGKVDDINLLGFDFIICDNDIENIKKYLEKGIVPIISKNNHISSILSEFNPLKNEGNAFLYEEANKWTIFYSIVRYLENYKFTFDNKNLVNNILKV